MLAQLALRIRAYRVAHGQDEGGDGEDDSEDERRVILGENCQVQ
jgi:hypothetical protein